MPRLFFFYGTLQPWAGNRAMRSVLNRLRQIGPATLTGSLYALPDARGWYPGWVAGDGAIRGTLCAATAMFGERELAALDRFEDYDPARPGRSLFVRERVRVRRPGGMGVGAEAYRFNRRLPGAAVELPEGDFLAWAARTGSRAFGSAPGQQQRPPVRLRFGPAAARGAASDGLAG